MMLSKSCNIIWTSNNTVQPSRSRLQTFMIFHFKISGSYEFGWDGEDESGSLTLLLLHRYAQFSHTLFSIKLEVEYFHAIRNDKLHIYFNLLHAPKTWLYFITGIWKGLDIEQAFDNEHEFWRSWRFYWSKLWTSRCGCTSYGKPTVLNPLIAELNPICHLLALLGAHHIFHVSGLRVNGHFKSNMMRSWHKRPQPLPSHTLHT